VIIAPPQGYDVNKPVRDLATAHPVLERRFGDWLLAMKKLGFETFLNEVYRYHVRQQWLWAQGRTAAQCVNAGIPSSWARPGPIVTNAMSCETSPHGWTRKDASGKFVPASAAVDVVPVGADGKPWTLDDPWDDWLNAALSIEAETGLRHFRSRGKKIWDKPHLQLTEWDDANHTLRI